VSKRVAICLFNRSEYEIENTSLAEFFGAIFSLVEEHLEVDRALLAKENMRGEVDDVRNEDCIILWSGPEQFQRGLPSPFPTTEAELSRLSMSCPEVCSLLSGTRLSRPLLPWAGSVHHDQ